MSANQIQEAIELALSDKLSLPVRIREMNLLRGGTMNKAYKVITDVGEFFVKQNERDSSPDIFRREVESLEMIRGTQSLRVPEVMGLIEVGEKEALLLEYVNSGTPRYDFWETFGSQLAMLHKNTSSQFGLAHSNYMGILPQSNTFHSDWVSFFRDERLIPVLRRAVDDGKADVSLMKDFDILFTKLDAIMPVELPAMLHGDLWAGNFLSDLDGEPVVYDPSVYYGHREVDLAMTQLFGGFDRSFYDSYHASFPLIPGWEERLPVYSLYPLLVHVNLFVGSYIQSVKNIVSRYI
jgi:protein-ribulosamine 3-kinase